MKQKPRLIKQDPPFTIKIELTEGCNLYCDFCALRSIRSGPGKNYLFMSTELATKLAEKISQSQWRSRIEFTLHGEPTMNPHYEEIVSIFRQALPTQNMMMTTNGGGLLRTPGPTARVSSLFEAGINTIAIDAYQDAPIFAKFKREYDSSKYPMRYYPPDADANPYRRLGKNKRLLTIFPDIRDTSKGVHAHVHNTAGCSGPKDRSYNNKRCARPFREFCVSYDGNVAICCNDWHRTYVCGNVNDTSLEDIWQGAAFYAARQKLLHYDRAFGPCDGCSSMSYRTGLLPDKQGVYTLPKPTKRTNEIITSVLAVPPLTMPISKIRGTEGQ